MKKILFLKNESFYVNFKIIFLIIFNYIFLYMKLFSMHINSNLKNKKIRFIISNAPSHKNYGDEAILISTKQFLYHYFPEFQQIEIYAREAINQIRLIKYIIKEKDIIIINGGGYFGLYDKIIKGEANIVEAFNHNPIIFFPCSILYNKAKDNIYKPFLDIFKNHKNLILFARETKSYQTAKYLFKDMHIYKVPDIATRLNMKFLENNNKREGVLLILRKDELLLTNNDRIFIKNLAKKYFKDQILEKDSNNFHIQIGQNKTNETLKFIKFISTKKLVITDRLHGMIFSVITGTPCISFGNSYHKVESSYNSWFQNLDYIIFIKRENLKNELEKYIEKFKNLKNFKIFN